MADRVYTSGVMLDGLDLSAYDDDLGVECVVTGVEGWSGSPASNLSIDQKTAEHGGWGSRRPRLASRIVTVKGYVAGDPGGVSLMLDRINDAASLDPVRAEFAEGNRVRWAMLQRDDEVIVDDSLAEFATYELQLVGTDPLKYGDTLVDSTGFPATSGGLAVPHDVPFGLDSTIASGQVAFVNPGNADGPVTLRIYGPVQAPVVTHLGTGRSIVFAASLFINGGDFVEVDMRNKRVLYNGTASRAGWVTQRGWSLFQPGGNVWSFSAPDVTSGARLEVTATAAWK